MNANEECAEYHIANTNCFFFPSHKMKKTNETHFLPAGLLASIGTAPWRSNDLARLFERPKRRLSVPKKSRFLRERPRSRPDSFVSGSVSGFVSFDG